MPKLKVAIIGPGVVGSAVGRLLRVKRFPIAAVAGRSPEGVRDGVKFIGGGRAARSLSAAARGADVVFLTTPDRTIRRLCEEIAAARGFKRGAVVFHCSGAYDAELLSAARSCNAHVGALHPIQSFASPEVAVKRMKGTYFTFDGDEKAAVVAEEIVKALGGKMLHIPPQNKVMYHVALCVLSNYLVAIADMGMIMLSISGLPPAEAARAARPLLRGTIENIGRVGLPDALTGPIARGDAQTVERHLRALAVLPKQIRRLYCELGLYTVRVAQRKGTLKPEGARRLVRIFETATRK